MSSLSTLLPPEAERELNGKIGKRIAEALSTFADIDDTIGVGLSTQNGGLEWRLCNLYYTISVSARHDLNIQGRQLGWLSLIKPLTIWRADAALFVQAQPGGARSLPPLSLRHEDYPELRSKAIRLALMLSQVVDWPIVIEDLGGNLKEIQNTLRWYRLKPGPQLLRQRRRPFDPLNEQTGSQDYYSLGIHLPTESTG